jgi:hypothetical protein
MQRALEFLRRRSRHVVLALCVLVCFPVFSWSRGEGLQDRIDRFTLQTNRMDRPSLPFTPQETKGSQMKMARREGRGPQDRNDWGGRGENYQSLTPEERERIDRNYQEWKSLPPEKQRVLRQRMKKWKEYPPEERELMRQRFNQWQELSPEERTRIRRQLEDWDRLSPGERDTIRRRFKP